MLTPTPAQKAVQSTIDLALEHARQTPHMTYEALGDRVFCTAHCRNTAEKIHVLDAFSAIPNNGLTTTDDPPTVSITIQQG